MNLFDLAGHGALVTGSSSGIGAAMADALERAGAAVLRHGRPGEAALPTSVLVHDLFDPAAPEALVEEAFRRNGGLDLLVCNAGSYFDVPFLDMDEGRLQKTLRLNVEQTYFTAQKFASRLAASGRPGAIVIVSSVNAYQSEEDSTAYDLSKGALVTLTRSMAISLASRAIRVNGIAPGLMRTPLTEPGLTTKRVDRFEKKILAGRIGVPEDCGGTCVFLCSEAARYITGQTIVVDGGLSVGQVERA
jgi:NAD(P)-dependent dehydrogenase (short-subunit alcohol dehydrogenase family)